MPSSAQWMSSTAKISGWRRLAASTSVRTAENRRSRICCGSSSSVPSTPESGGGSIPSGRPSATASRSGDSSLSVPATSASTPPWSLRQAAPASSVSTISKVPRTISPSAQ